MTKVKQSFLSNLLGRSTYDEFRCYARTITVIGACFLTIIYLLSFTFHWKFISILMNLFTGTSILFALFIASLIITLDIQVEVEKTERNSIFDAERPAKSTSYRFTIVWASVLIALGICAIYFSNKYRKYYSFECNTFFVDYQKGIYHFDYDNKCEIKENTSNLKKLKGYQIPQNYTLCTWCKDWADDVEYEYINNRFYRK